MTAIAAKASWTLRSRRLGTTLFAGWAAVTAASIAFLPGETLELALIGVVAALAWAEIRRTEWTGFQVSVALIVLAAPLLGTWPARKWQAGVGRLPTPLAGVANLHSLLLIAAVAVGGPTLARRAVRVRGSLMVGGALLVTGGLLGALAHADRAALSDAWVGLAVPVGVALVVAAGTKTEADAWRFLGLGVIAALVPIGVGIAAYVVSFGFPTSPGDLVFGKLALFRPHLFQDVTFGNVGHFGDVALLLLPAALLATRARILLPAVRVACGVAAIGLMVVLLLVLSRAALAIGLLIIALLVALLARPEHWRDALLPAAVFAALLAIASAPSVANSIGELLPFSSHSVSATSSPAASDTSEQMRGQAIRTGLRIAERHLPFGIGSGNYPAYDPVHTAPHSLFVQVLAEDGVLGAAGLLVVAVFVLVALLRRAVDRRSETRQTLLLRLSCLVGALAFLVDAISSGSPLALGQLNVWPVLLAILLGVLGSVRSWA